VHRCILSASENIFRHGKGAKARSSERDLTLSFDGGEAVRFISFAISMLALQVRE